MLWTASMGSNLFGYQLGGRRGSGTGKPFSCPRVAIGNTGSSTLTANRPHRELINPPLPTTLCAHPEGGLLALGRADGTYSIYEVQRCRTEEDASTATDKEAVVVVEEILAAPAHEGNGLVTVRWTREGQLLSLALSGEVTVWDVQPMLAPVTEDSEEVGELPPVVWADTVPRRHQATMNSCELSVFGRLVIGDTAGDVHTVSLTD